MQNFIVLKKYPLMVKETFLNLIYGQKRCMDLIVEKFIKKGNKN